MKTYFIKGIVISLADHEPEQMRADIIESETFNGAIQTFKEVYVGELEVLNLLVVKQVVVSETI
jgi:hypothetical protein